MTAPSDPMKLPSNPHYLEQEDLLNLMQKVEEQGEADWRLFLSYADEIAIVPGDVLIRQADVERVVYILTEGELEVQVSSAEGQPPDVVTTVKPVAIIGEQTFLDAQPRTATLAARTPGTVFRLGLTSFDRLRMDEPEIAAAFLFDVARSLSMRLRHAAD